MPATCTRTAMLGEASCVTASSVEDPATKPAPAVAVGTLATSSIASCARESWMVESSFASVIASSARSAVATPPSGIEIALGNR